MVFKLLPPVSLRAFAFHIFLGLIFCCAVFVLGGSVIFFMLGFLFFSLYFSLYFYSVFLFFHRARPSLATLFMLGKWLFLLVVLLFVSRLPEQKSFLLGLSGFFSLPLSFILFYRSAKI